MVGVMATSSKRIYASKAPPRTAAVSTPDLPFCQRLSEPHRQVWLAVVGSLLLSPGSWWDKVLFVPLKSLFPQSSGSSVIKSS